MIILYSSLIRNQYTTENQSIARSIASQNLQQKYTIVILDSTYFRVWYIGTYLLFVFDLVLQNAFFFSFKYK